MGSSYSYMDEEKKSWKKLDMEFDGDCRRVSKKFFADIENGEYVSLCSKECTLGGIQFEHWFISCGAYNVEFGPVVNEKDTYLCKVNISTNSNKQGKKESKTLNDEIRQRIGHVLGLKNFSLCLRNSEHVANYIFYNRWFSSQMNEDGILMKQFRSQLEKEKILNNVNSSPLSMRPDWNMGKELYSFVDKFDHFTATRMDYYLDAEENTYNILFIGATGKKLIRKFLH